MKNIFLIGLGTFVFSLLGLALYRLQGPAENPVMNLWGVIAFAAVGTSLGLIVAEPDGSRGNFFDGWL